MGKESQTLRDLFASVITGTTINVDTSTATDFLRAVIDDSGVPALRVSGSFGTSGGSGTSGTSGTSGGGTGTLVATDYLYFGDQTTDGSWRIDISGADLIIEKKIGGNWVVKSTITG